MHGDEPSATPALLDVADYLLSAAGAAEAVLDGLTLLNPDGSEIYNRRNAQGSAEVPPLSDYAKLHVGPEDLRTTGYTEASRGCKHLCRHCPIVPVYNGAFRIIQQDVVLSDIRQQIAAGASHITFGDPDFFNAPTHAVKLVKALQAEFPDLTIKVEHLLKYSQHLPIEVPYMTEPWYC